ncbi:hypothetical protein ACC717_05945 [Rhizobium ruizarguesonis]
MANDEMNDFASVDAEMQRRDESIRRHSADMQASTFSHANSYVTVVVFGSYAGMFAIWSNVKDRLSADMTYWTGMLIAISMMSFVAFEIFKMIILSLNMLAVRKLLIRDMSPEERDDLRSEISGKANIFLSRVIIPVWIAALAFTATTGFGAGILLLTAFIRGLAKV